MVLHTIGVNKFFGDRCDLRPSVMGPFSYGGFFFGILGFQCLKLRNVNILVTSDVSKAGAEDRSELQSPTDALLGIIPWSFQKRPLSHFGTGTPTVSWPPRTGNTRCLVL